MLRKLSSSSNAATGAPLVILVHLGKHVNQVDILGTQSGFALRNAIHKLFSNKLSYCDADDLVLQIKDATGKLRLLENYAATIVDELEEDEAGNYEVYVEAPPKKEEGSKFAPNESLLDPLSEYLSLSPQIQKGLEWKAVQDKIEECAADPAQPFILLDGPSGVGKTQFALSQTKKSIYLLLTPPGDTSQPVYKPFFQQSLRLLAEIGKDISQLQTQDMNAIIFFPEMEYFTLGYLARLWDELGPTNHKGKGEWPLRQACLRFRFQSVTMTIKEFRERCPEFLLLLDETPFVDDDLQKKTLVDFIRNLTRNVGVAVLLGTDSTFTNIVDCCGSRGGEAPKTWCHVFTSYPRPTLASLAIRFPCIEEWAIGKHCSKPLTDFLNYVIASHRPWLTILFVKFLIEAVVDGKKRGGVDKKKSDLGILEEVCNKVGNVVMKAKYMQKGAMWLVGQKRLPLCVYRSTKRRVIHDLLHGHMAYLGLPGHAESVTLELHNDGLYCDGKVFKPFACFPSAANEALLYLGLLQSPLTNAFTNPASGQRMATCHAYAYNSREVSLVNSQAVKKSGNKYEVILAVGMIISSHEAWLTGQTVLSFLPRLFYEVCGVKAELSKRSAAFVRKRFRGRKIAYLSPLHSSWPQALAHFPGAAVATPCRPADKTRVFDDVDCVPFGDEEVKFESEDEAEEDEKDEEDEEEEDEGEDDDDDEDDEEDEEDAEEADEADQDGEEDGDEQAEVAVVRMTGEATKNRENKFSFSEMVRRIPDKSELHVVLGYSISKKKPRPPMQKIIRENDALLVRLVVRKNGRVWSLKPLLKEW